MKLIGRFKEFPNTEILLFRTPPHNIQYIITHDKSIEVKVQEYKPRKITIQKLGENDLIILPNKELRHQIVLTKDIPHMLKVKLYSIPLNAESIKHLNLNPIEEVSKKEKLARSLDKLVNSR